MNLLFLCSMLILYSPDGSITGTSVIPDLYPDVTDFCRRVVKSLCLQQQHTITTALSTTNTMTPTMIPIMTLMETMKASIPSANKSPENIVKN